MCGIAALNPHPACEGYIGKPAGIPGEVRCIPCRFCHFRGCRPSARVKCCNPLILKENTRGLVASTRGFMAKPWGSRAEPAGSRANPVGSSLAPAGSRANPAGSRLASAGSWATPVGSRVEPLGSWDDPACRRKTRPSSFDKHGGLLPSPCPEASASSIPALMTLRWRRAMGCVAAFEEVRRHGVLFSGVLVRGWCKWMLLLHTCSGPPQP